MAACESLKTATLFTMGSVRNRPVRPGMVRTGTDGKNPSVREQDGDGAVFLRLDGDGRKGRPSMEKS